METQGERKVMKYKKKSQARRKVRALFREADVAGDSSRESDSKRGGISVRVPAARGLRPEARG